MAGTLGVCWEEGKRLVNDRCYAGLSLLLDLKLGVLAGQPLPQLACSGTETVVPGIAHNEIVFVQLFLLSCKVVREKGGSAIRKEVKGKAPHRSEEKKSREVVTIPQGCAPHCSSTSLTISL